MLDEHRVAFETLAAANEAMSIGSLAESTVPLLADWLGARHGMFVRLGSADMQCFGSISELGTFGNDVYRHEYFHRDPVVAAELASPDMVLRSSRVVDYRWFRHTELFAEIYRDNDVSTVLMCKMAPAGDGLLTLVFMRGAKDPDFTARSEAFLRRLRPALSASCRRIRESEETATIADLLEELLVEADPRARVVFGADGATVWVSRSAEALLGDRVPCHLDRLLSVEPRPSGASSALRAVILERSGEPPLRATLHRGTGGAEAYSVAVFDDLSQPSPRVRALAEEIGLTPTETQVLVALSLGMSTERIARCQFVSLNTTRTHIKRVLTKSGVHSRAELRALVEGGEIVRA